MFLAIFALSDLVLSHNVFQLYVNDLLSEGNFCEKLFPRGGKRGESENSAAFCHELPADSDSDYADIVLPSVFCAARCIRDTL